MSQDVNFQRGECVGRFTASLPYAPLLVIGWSAARVVHGGFLCDQRVHKKKKKSHDTHVRALSTDFFFFFVHTRVRCPVDP